jgi:PAS domain S-box-containing protein
MTRGQVLDSPHARIFVEHMRDGASTLTADGLVAYANNSLAQLLGRPSDQIVGAPMISFVANDDREAFEALVNRARWGSVATIHLLAGPGQCAVPVAAEALDAGGESLTYLTFTDLTAPRAAERQLVNSVARTMSILDASNEAFLGMDGAGRIIDWNRQSEAMFGWPREEALGRLLPETILPVEFQPGLTWFLPGGADTVLSRRFETRAVDRYGREFPIEMALWVADDGEGGASFHAFVHEISERRTAEDAIRVALDSALEAKRVKSQLLSNMSQEIRRHMDRVLAMSDVVLGTAVDGTQRDYLLDLKDSGHDLLTIVNQILDFSRVEAGAVVVKTVDFDLAELVETVADHLAVQASDKGLFLQFKVGPELSWVHGDPVCLRQILTNLSANAVKFTETGSVTIEVTVAQGPQRRSGDRRHVRFAVKDTGIGIDPSARNTLLAPSGQAHAATTNHPGGTGLGLAICRQLLDLMGGPLDYDSWPGMGSTFWFEVPLPACEPTS